MQKIRTIEVDGKTIKLQIVSSFMVLILASGTQLDKRDLRPLPAATTKVLMESLLLTTLLTERVLALLKIG